MLNVDRSYLACAQPNFPLSDLDFRFVVNCAWKWPESDERRECVATIFAENGLLILIRAQTCQAQNLKCVHRRNQREKYCNEMWKGELPKMIYLHSCGWPFTVSRQRAHTRLCVDLNDAIWFKCQKKQVNESAWIEYAVSGHSLAADDEKFRICIYSLAMRNEYDFFFVILFRATWSFCVSQNEATCQPSDWKCQSKKLNVYIELEVWICKRSHFFSMQSCM